MKRIRIREGENLWLRLLPSYRVFLCDFVLFRPKNRQHLTSTFVTNTQHNFTMRNADLRAQRVWLRVALPVALRLGLRKGTLHDWRLSAREGNAF